MLVLQLNVLFHITTLPLLLQVLHNLLDLHEFHVAVDYFMIRSDFVIFNDGLKEVYYRVYEL